MRKMIALLLALACVLSLAACGGSEAPAATQAPAANAPAAAPAAPAETPAAPTNLVIPSASCVANLNPLLETMKEGVIMLNPMYDPITILVKKKRKTEVFLLLLRLVRITQPWRQ